MLTEPDLVVDENSSILVCTCKHVLQRSISYLAGSELNTYSYLCLLAFASVAFFIQSQCKSNYDGTHTKHAVEILLNATHGKCRPDFECFNVRFQDFNASQWVTVKSKQTQCQSKGPIWLKTFSDSQTCRVSSDDVTGSRKQTTTWLSVGLFAWLLAYPKASKTIAFPTKLHQRCAYASSHMLHRYSKCYVHTTQKRSTQ